ncbi:protein-cysteine N-palmitoyltransferase HHAT isoform X11 [Narcine bancroftii]|uniref:protein-cysteine N-palmitoyltransferase HHAT isoform X11 n=1 Tax=Narcine bancroftii TaxID=1343680 RepID=UPI003831DF8E
MRCGGAVGLLPSAPLPTFELTLYLATTVGCHLYSFYELFKLSRIYEKNLDTEFGFEKGFFIWGFKKDPTDFEWSFWTEWVKKLLMWTLLGHIIISQVTNAFFPKFRTWLLMMYGMLACFITVGYKGLAVILLHLVISFTVAQLRVPALSWICSVLLLYSLQMDSLGKMKKCWYETENEYFLLLFCLALCNLRYTSFSLEYCWHRVYPQSRCMSFCWLLAYVFYYPIFHNGPIICYDDFNNQMRRILTSVPRMDHMCLLLGVVRIFFWWWLTESLLHFMYIHAIQHQETILESASYWILGGLAFAHTMFFYLKYLLLYGIPSIIMYLDGIEPPRLPRCTSSLYSFTGTWREFDVGLHRWLVRFWKGQHFHSAFMMFNIDELERCCPSYLYSMAIQANDILEEYKKSKKILKEIRKAKRRHEVALANDMKLNPGGFHKYIKKIVWDKIGPLGSTMCGIVY